MKRLTGSVTLIATISLILILLSSCSRAPKEIQPKINYIVQDRYFKQLPSPFAELTPEEARTRWGAEYLIGMSFARNLDLYQAITAFKRAEILAPQEATERRMEIGYEILLSYYLGRRYAEAAQVFKESPLSQVSIDFPAFHDLLIILYDVYEQLGERDKSLQILNLVKQYYPMEHETLILSTALQKADFSTLSQITTPYIQQLLKNYKAAQKSPTKAATFNAIIPGAGYLYLGQRQTAITALLINGLFIAAVIYFFRRRAFAAGIIFLSFAIGWYFGGIYGGASEAKFYNERLYEKLAIPVMQKEGLFPIFRLEYAF